MSKNIFQRIFSSTPRAKVRWSFVLIIAITLGAAIISGSNYYNSLATKISLPKVKDVSFRLGLDLQGGTQLVYEADVSKVGDKDKDDALEGVRDVIERRINVFGVSEPVVQVNKTMSGKYRIIAELAGIKDVSQAIKMIGETPLLEFKEKSSSTTQQLSADDRKKMTDYNVKINEQAKAALGQAVKGGDFLTLAKANNQQLSNSDGATSPDEGDLGYLTATSSPEVVALVKGLKPGEVVKNLIVKADGISIFKLEDKKTANKIDEYRVRQIFFPVLTEKDMLAALGDWQNTSLTGKYLKRAVVQFNPQDNSPEVSLEFDAEGAKMFEDITARNIGKQVAIYLDNYAISAPNVNEKISGGKAVISGSFSISEAKLLTQRLNTGALPVPISLVSQQTVGATLGQQSVDNSIKAGLVGLLIVAIFMICFYRLPGLLSVFALLIYGVVSLAIFKLWPVTLTLSGIAGFILSIGMAVDANILIFERMKEELRKGKLIDAAVLDGFNRAWPSIRDSNFTTLIVCLVLILFSASVIKGFAVTLSLGVIISLFSAIFVTRNFLKLISSKFLAKHTYLVLGAKKADSNNK